MWGDGGGRAEDDDLTPFAPPGVKPITTLESPQMRINCFHGISTPGKPGDTHVVLRRKTQLYIVEPIVLEPEAARTPPAGKRATGARAKGKANVAIKGARERIRAVCISFFYVYEYLNRHEPEVKVET